MSGEHLKLLPGEAPPRLQKGASTAMVYADNGNHFGLDPVEVDQDLDQTGVRLWEIQIESLSIFGRPILVKRGSARIGAKPISFSVSFK